ncbi:MAG: hypothetical protein IJR17_03720 [Clostridia bacterium]|nr:hypothetical protein [Clostridia bacterium]
MLIHETVSEFTSFQNIEVWNFVIMLSLLSGALLLAGALRRMIPVLRRSLLPGAVLAGFLLLLFDGVYRLVTGVSFFRSGNNLITLEAMTYHGLGLGVVAMSLQQSRRVKSPHRNREVFRSGAITVCGYLIQGVAGLLITLAFFYAMQGKVFPSSGILLPLGYGQGPGQAFNWGLTFENSYGFVNGSSFGLTVAALGFVSASIGGVLYMNVMQRKGKLQMKKDADMAENLTAEAITGKNELPLSESMDKFTVQAALVLVTYILAYGLMKGIDVAFGGVKFYVNTLQSTIWGFNFLFGLLACVIVKALLKGFSRAGWMQREYRNSFMLNRISGWMFDIMVVASIASIDLTAFTHPEFILPLVLICLAGAVVTFLFVRFASHRLFPAYEHEQFLCFYGMLTGTLSTGLILCREIDPLFDTPAAENLIFQNLYAVLLGAPFLLVLGLIAQNQPATTWLVFAILAVYFLLLCGVLFGKQLLARKK